MRRLALLVGLFALLIPASVGLASDGVLEINQACAQSGCFGGDTGGWPVTIIREGSYRLTDNLTVPDENTSGIKVSANDVSIDLNGFAIIGPVTCSGSPLTCSHASGTGSGIERASVNLSGASVKNGSISGMGHSGVYLGSQSEVTNLRVHWNRRHGILIGSGSTVSGSLVYENGYVPATYGIYAGNGATVSGNTVMANGNIGIYAGYGATVSGNTVYQNDENGIFANPGSTVSGNTAYKNGYSGIYGTSGVTVSGNTAYDNGISGIDVVNGSTVSGNTVHGNDGYGLRFSGTGSAYSGNVISDNTLGTVSGTAVQLGQNACNGNTTCP